MSVGNANDYLPFDVLGHVFFYYASEENIKYPLETLLLVCKSNIPWTEPTFAIWTTRLPLRLARCGPDVPLDVNLRNLLYINTHQGLAEIQHFASGLSCKSVFHRDGEKRKMYSCHIGATACALQALTGSNGEICARWRSFTLYLGEHQYDEVRAALSRATPLLENLELRSVQFWEADPSLRLFPQVHNLKRLSLLECKLPSLPRCDNLLDVCLHWQYGIHMDLSSLQRAQKLQSLSLRSSVDAWIRLPAQLPNLRVLILHGFINTSQTNIFTCQMPHIFHLSLHCKGYDPLDQVLHCEGLPIEKLTRLSLVSESRLIYNKDEILVLMDSLHAFFYSRA